MATLRNIRRGKRNKEKKKKKFIIAVGMVFFAIFLLFLLPHFFLFPSFPPSIETGYLNSDVYMENKLISNYAKCYNSISDAGKGYDVMKMFDRKNGGYFKTTVFNISDTNPLDLTFDFVTTDKISSWDFDYLRFYYYNPDGLSNCPDLHDIYVDGNLVATGLTNTSSSNGEWVTIDFPNTSGKTLTWSIKDIQGDNKKNYILINEAEIFSTQSSGYVNHNLDSIYGGIPLYWNGLQWSYSIHIDDIRDADTLVSTLEAEMPGMPITMMCWDSYGDVQRHISKGHEYGGHMVNNQLHNMWGEQTNWTYADAWPYVKAAIDDVESAVSGYGCSRWGDTCLSMSNPYNNGNYHTAQAQYDVGFRVCGHLFHNRYGNNYGASLSWITPTDLPYSSNVALPRNEMDWMGIARGAGKFEKGWDSCLWDICKKSGSWGDTYKHQYEVTDQEFKEKVNSDHTGWRCTWGEIRSYQYYRMHTSLSYNISVSNSTKKVYDINVYPTPKRIWGVPLTFQFNISNIRNIRVLWRNNGTVYEDNFVNIEGNQSMQEGYRYDENVLYLSTKCQGRQIEITGDFDT